MTVQIKLISQEVLHDLLNQEGDTVPMYLVAALHFEPPRPLTDKEMDRLAEAVNDPVEVAERVPFGMQQDFHYVQVVLLRVAEPWYYKEYDGSHVFILPSDISLIDYEMLSTIHSEHGAWAYRLEPRYWSPYDIEDDPMDDAHWFFKEYKIPEFDLANKETH